MKEIEKSFYVGWIVGLIPGIVVLVLLLSLPDEYESKLEYCKKENNVYSCDLIAVPTEVKE